MKKHILYILLLIPVLAKTQNLVPNPGFETTGTVECGWTSSPGDFDNSTVNWTAPTIGTPDIFSTLINPDCSNYQPRSTYSTDLPNGNQSPHGGNIFAGFYTYVDGYEYREYIQNQLTSPMVIGKTYAVSMYVSLAGNSEYATNNVGIYLSATSTDSSILGHLGYIPQVNDTNVISDTTDWVLITDTILATAAWDYIVIGDFYSDFATTLVNYNPTGYWARTYYYIDDVSIVAVAAVAPPTASFQASDSVICDYDCINFTDHSSGNATSWLWTFTGGTPSTSTDKNPQNICYLTSGNYDVELVASNSGGSNSVTFSNYIRVSPNPPTPDITQSGDTLKCSFDPSYISYQWYYNDTLLTGGTNSSYIAFKNGNYNVKVTNGSGCNIAVGITVVLNGINNYNSDNSISIFPNPSKDEFTVYGLKFTNNTIIELYSIIGEKITNTQFAKGEKEITVDARNLSPGIYFVRLQDANEGRWLGRFVKG